MIILRLVLISLKSVSLSRFTPLPAKWNSCLNTYKVFLKNALIKLWKVKRIPSEIFDSVSFKKQDCSVSASETGENLYLFILFHHLFLLEYVFTYSIPLMWWENEKYLLLELTKRRSWKKYFIWTCCKFWSMINIFRNCETSLDKISSELNFSKTFS